MNHLSGYIYRAQVLILLICSAACSGRQDQAVAAIGDDSLISVARSIIDSAGYCALITLDSSGTPYVRAMEPFTPEAKMVIWMATNPRSRKVNHIRRNPAVTLYYFDAARPGYVTIYGTARLVDDSEEKAAHWKEGWEAFYPDREANYLLIAVTPSRMEVVSAADGILGDEATWEPPVLDLQAR